MRVIKADLKCAVYLYFFLLAFTPLSILAKDQANLGPNQKMTLIGQEMLTLFPFLFSEKKFIDPQNHKKIHETLVRLNQHIQDVGPHMKSLAPTRKVSFKLLKDHLKESEEVFQGPRKVFAQTMLKASTSMCMSCHTMDSKKKTLFPDVSRSFFQNDFEYAEFLFMTRNYQKALTYYREYIKNYQVGRGDDEVNLPTALRRNILIYIRILKDPVLAKSELSQLLQQKNLSDDLKQNIRDWIIGFEEWKNLPANLGEKGNLQKLIKMISTRLEAVEPEFIISGKDEVTYLRLASMLNDYLNQYPHDPELPTILYWLSQCEKAMEFNFFYPLAEVYLKECIQYDSQHPYAKKCFQEYEDMVIFSYSGSSGTHIPKVIKMEMEAIRRKLMKEKEKEKKVKKASPKKL